MSRSSVCYFTAGKRKARKVSEAWAQGAGGGFTETATAALLDGPAAFYGISGQLAPLLAQARREGRRWWYLDNAYLGPRGVFFRVTRGGLQVGPPRLHDGLAPGLRPDAARLRRLGVRVAPWRRSGGHVLICPPGDFMAQHGYGYPRAWLRDTLATLRRATDRELRVRPKPPAGASGQPLAEDLRDCWAVVTWASNVTVTALIAGVPVFADGPSAARPLALDDPAAIEAPARGLERHDWLAGLAANQWTLGELRDGTAWRRLTAGGLGAA